MATFRRLGIIIALATVALIFSGLYSAKQLSERIIVLGVGIDYNEEGYDVAVEVAQSSPQASGDSSSGNHGGKLIKGSGRTVSLALSDVNEKSGKVLSLGQSSVIVLGEELYTNEDIAHVFSFFSLSDAFKDGTPVAACHGRADELLSVQVPTDAYVGLVLQNAIQSGGELINVPYVSVVGFTKQQAMPMKCSFLPVITFVEEDSPTSKTDYSSKKPSGHFEFNGMAIFRSGKLVYETDKKFKETFTFVTEEKSFHTFAVEDAMTSPPFARTVGLGTVSKDVSQSCKLTDNGAVYAISAEIKVRRLRTDTEGNVSGMKAISYKEISQDNAVQVQNILHKDLFEMYSLLVETECDATDIYGDFFKSYANEWLEYVTLNPDWMKKLKVEINVKVIS